LSPAEEARIGILHEGPLRRTTVTDSAKTRTRPGAEAGTVGSDITLDETELS
jgi:hypothetical protein